MESTENWNPSVGHEGSYEVSDLGRVRSLDRIVINSRGVAHRLKGIILVGAVREKDGYRNFTLGKDGRGISRTLHSLVMEAFVGPRPHGMEIRHLDGNPANNALSNLVYGTAKENARDRMDQGTAWPQSSAKCKHGHDISTPDKYYVGKYDGYTYRVCKLCARDRAARYNAKKHA